MDFTNRGVRVSGDGHPDNTRVWVNDIEVSANVAEIAWRHDDDGTPWMRITYSEPVDGAEWIEVAAVEYATFSHHNDVSAEELEAQVAAWKAANPRIHILGERRWSFLKDDQTRWQWDGTCVIPMQIEIA